MEHVGVFFQKNKWNFAFNFIMNLEMGFVFLYYLSLFLVDVSKIGDKASIFLCGVVLEL